MFEQEVEMEKQQSSVLPLLMIVALIISIVGVAAYYVVENRKVLASEEAATLVTATLQQQAPPTIDFHVGSVVSSVSEKPRDPNYRLLEKAGLVKIGKDVGRATPISLTPAGEAFLKRIPGVIRTKTPNENSDTIVVPLASRKLVGTPQVTMTSMGHATVEFAWAWDPTKMGDLFDASGSMVQGFNTWDRGTLIDKYNAKFYHGASTKAALPCVRGDKGWEVAQQ
jgi:hypothetical protein